MRKSRRVGMRFPVAIMAGVVSVSLAVPGLQAQAPGQGPSAAVAAAAAVKPAAPATLA